MQTFRSFVVKKNESAVIADYQASTTENLSPGNVLIDVAYSSINYKDALATLENGGVIRNYPMIPGIDLSGTVLSSESAAIQAGSRVLVTGYGLGVTHTGGYSERARVPSDWVVPLPESLTLKDSMFIGTAGFTAALAISRLEKQGMRVQDQPNILITGATGGVGSLAISMLHMLGYTQITAISRKKAHYTAFLKKIGANRILTPDEIRPEKAKILDSQNFHYMIDTVGGEQLTPLIAQLHYGGSIALCGNAGGISLSTTVLPFILRGVSLLGIDSVLVPLHEKQALWQRIATDFFPFFAQAELEEIVPFDQLKTRFPTFLSGNSKGRKVVQIFS